MADRTTRPPVTDEAIRAVQAADSRWAAVTRLTDWRPLSEGRVRNLLEAAAGVLGCADHG